MYPCQMAPRKVQKKVEEKKKEESVSEHSESENEESDEETASEEDESQSAEESASNSDSAESAESVSEEASEEKKEKTEEESEGKTIFIKGISYNATEEELQGLFGKFGDITEIRIPRNNFGKGKGFAYIEFKEQESCTKSLSLSGTECEGRQLVVDQAKSGRPAPKEGGNSSYNQRDNQRDNQRFSQRDKQGEITVFLGNVPFEFDQDEFKDFLKDHADVKSVRVPMDRESGRPKGFAFATFESQNEADKLISSNLVFQDRTIRAQISEQRKPGNFNREGGNFSRDGGNGNFRGRRDDRRDDGYGRGRRDDGYGNNKRSWASENTDSKKHVKFE
ncbi:hypothetical protein NEFER03_0402 [Nematocida sp. LUAm3]|nr:hypothetical protein NEFER03_0402 [Nematocida sp. LUAm3]